MKEKDVISLLHKIYVAGYVHGDNQSHFSEIGIYDAFCRLIAGESPLLDGERYDIKDNVDEILRLFDVSGRSEQLCSCSSKILPNGNIQFSLCRKCQEEMNEHNWH